MWKLQNDNIIQNLLFYKDMTGNTPLDISLYPMPAPGPGKTGAFLRNRFLRIRSPIS